MKYLYVIFTKLPKTLRNSFKIFPLLLIFTFQVFLSSCVSNDIETQESLIIYSGRSESLVGPIIESFIESTGIQVDVRYGGTAELAATLLEEGDSSPADLFFAQDPGGLGAVAEQGMLSALPEDMLSLVDPRFIDPSGNWVGISGRARVIVYNTDTLSPEDLPTDLQGFTDPKWKGKIGLPPTNTSFQTMLTGMREIWGEAETKLWLEGILENDPVYYEKNTPTVAAVAAGEVEVGFVNHYYLYRFLAEEGESFSARNYFLPSGGPGSLILVSAIGVIESSDNFENAEKFIQFLLSNEAQQYFANETFEYPLIEGISIPANLPPIENLNSVNISLGDLVDLDGTIKMLQEVEMLP